MTGEPHNSDSVLPRRVGVIGALGVMIGIIIGSGIFRTPTSIAAQLDSPALILALWGVGGLISLLGALTFAEMACMYPQSGGVYVFIREGFGRCAAFVFGWTYMLITKPAAAAGIAVLMGETLNRLLGTAWDVRVTTSIVLIAFTIVNVIGVRLGAGVAVFLTIIKCAVLLAIVALAYTLIAKEPLDAPTKAFVSKPLWASLAVVMAGIMWTYDGWSDVGAIAGEIKDPQRNLPRIYLLGTLFLTGLYIAVNAAYMHVIPLSQMRALDTVAPDVMSRLVGPIGATLASVAVIIAVLGSTHGSILTGARITFQQSRDGLLFRFLGKVDPKFQTPAIALWSQLVLSLMAVWWLQSFDKLAGSFVFTMWIFYGMAGMSIFILRKKQPDRPRSFRCPGYPIVPALFILSAAAMTTLQIADDPGQNLPWIGLLLLGIPAYVIWNRVRKPDAANA